MMILGTREKDAQVPGAKPTNERPQTTHSLTPLTNAMALDVT